jgi:hypothetical protein
MRDCDLLMSRDITKTDEENHSETTRVPSGNRVANFHIY